MFIVVDAAITLSEPLYQSLPRFAGLVEGVKPVFLEERADFSFHNLLKPFSGVTDRYPEGWRHIAMPDSELAA